MTQRSPSDVHVQESLDILNTILCLKCDIQSNLRGFSPKANYTDRATAACRRG
jgi:hypothetical protein